MWWAWIIAKPFSHLPVHRKIVFHEIGPWCQKAWAPLLYMRPSWWIHVIILLSKYIRCTKPGENSNVNCILGWQWCVGVGSSAVTHAPSGGRCWWWGRLCPCVGSKEMEISALSPQFFCEPKAALKIKFK